MADDIASLLGNRLVPAAKAQAALKAAVVEFFTIDGDYGDKRRADAVATHFKGAVNDPAQQYECKNRESLGNRLGS